MPSATASRLDAPPALLPVRRGPCRRWSASGTAVRLTWCLPRAPAPWLASVVARRGQGDMGGDAGAALHRVEVAAPPCAQGRLSRPGRLRNRAGDRPMECWARPRTQGSREAKGPVARRPGLWNWTGERFTATRRGSGRTAAVRQACRRADSPIGSMRPVSSASGMNSLGETGPCLGWLQRGSAPKPTRRARRQGRREAGGRA